MIIDAELLSGIEAAKACPEGVAFASQCGTVEEFWQKCPNPQWLLWWVWYCKNPHPSKLDELAERLQPKTVLESSLLTCHLAIREGGDLSEFADTIREVFGSSIPGVTASASLTT